MGWIRAIIAVALVWGAVTTDATAQVQVASGHPRIYLRPGDEAALRVRAASPAIAPFYQSLKGRMDGAGSPHSNNEVRGFEIESLALLHVVEAPSMAYRDKFVQSWARLSYGGGISHWDLPNQVMGHALALDWMWSDLTPSQRQQLGQTLFTMTDELLAYASHDLGPNPGYGNQMSDYSNQLYYHWGTLAFTGVVLAGEGIDDARAASYLTLADDLLHNHMIPAMNQEAGGDAELWMTSGFQGNGGWGEDIGHINWTHPMFGRMLEAWRTGTGEDLFPSCNGLASLGHYLAWLRRPGGGFTPKGNTGYPANVSDKHIGVLGALTSARYGDGYGRWLKDLTWAGTTYGFHQVGAVLWYDATVPLPNFAALPTTMHFQGQGEVVVRSGWNSNDTWLYLRAGPIYNGHQHDDQGNLLIEAHGGELFVENAGNGQDPTSNHNTLRIGGDQIAYGNNQVQYVRPFAATPQERGRVNQVSEAADYSYVATDFGNAYSDTQVAPPKDGKVTREVVVILPDIVLVRDRVSGSGTLEFLLHTWPGTTSVNAGTKTATVVHGSGRGWVRTLLPSTATMSLSSQGSTQRITVTDGSGQATRTLLHVFYLSPAAAAFTPSDLTLIDEPGAVGARLTDRQGDVWEIRLDKNGVGLVGVQRNPGNSGSPPPQVTNLRRID